MLSDQHQKALSVGRRLTISVFESGGEAMSMRPCQICAELSGEDDYLSLKSTDGLGGRRHGGLSRDRVVVFHDRCVTVTSARLDSRREIVLTRARR
jgi:hypothetical protein